MNAVEIEQAITDQRLSEQQRVKQQDATEPFRSVYVGKLLAELEGRAE